MAITNVWAQFPGGYLTDETRPTQYDFVKAPPSLTSGAFAYDFFYYQWGREQRDSADVSAQALSDEAAKLYSVYGESNCIGINLTPETTPEIILLCERAVTDVSTANTAVKNKYQRVRPFATFKEESLKPWTDDEEALLAVVPASAQLQPTPHPRLPPSTTCRAANSTPSPTTRCTSKTGRSTSGSE